MEKSVKGLTLIEVMIVTVIIALFLILSYVVYITQINKARDAKRKSDIYDLRTAFENYEKDQNCYPTTLPACGPDTGWEYLDRIPCDPETHQGYFYYPEPDTICPKWYWIFANLQNTRDPIIDELDCTNGCGDGFNYYQTSPNAPEPPKGVPSPSSPLPPGCEITYGCKSGACVQICMYDGIPECGPNYGESTCKGCSDPEFCCQDENGDPRNECT